MDYFRFFIKLELICNTVGTKLFIYLEKKIQNLSNLLDQFLTNKQYDN